MVAMLAASERKGSDPCGLLQGVLLGMRKSFGKERWCSGRGKGKVDQQVESVGNSGFQQAVRMGALLEAETARHWYPGSAPLYRGSRSNSVRLQYLASHSCRAISRVSESLREEKGASCGLDSLERVDRILRNIIQSAPVD